MSRITTDLHEIVTALQAEDCVAIPTETVYGLAALASSPAAVAKVFSLKQRPLTHPLIVHVAEDFDITQLVTTVPDYAKSLMKAFWPGPLTLVLPRKPGKILDIVTAHQDTVAVRCPAHPLAQAVLSGVGAPLVAPSANPFGKVSPTTAAHVQEAFQDSDLLVLEGGRCRVGIESTIVAALSPTTYQLLRPGVIDEGQIKAIVAQEAKAGAGVSLRVSGQLPDHYQPLKPVRCFETIDALKDAYAQISYPVYVLSFSEDTCFEQGFLWPKNPAQVAYELYYQLRLADLAQVGEIWVELPPPLLAWQGVRDRLLKAGMKD